VTPVASSHPGALDRTPRFGALWRSPVRGVLLLLAAFGGRLGGQAVLEGVMMRGPERWVVAVRRPDNRIGVLVKSARVRGGRGLARVPVIRGIVVAWEALGVGAQSLAESAKVIGGEDEMPTRRSVSRVGVAITLAVALALAVALFFLVPLAVTQNLLGLEPGPTFWLVEGGVRIGVLILYLVGLSLIPDMRRLMQYHAAEHMVIHAYERGMPIEPQSAADQPRSHVRCGTGYLLVVMIVAILLFAAAGDRTTLETVGIRIVGLPLIAGVAYELMRLIAMAQDSILGRMLAWPGNLLQRLTTRTPDPEHLEVACVALRRLLGVDGAVADLRSRAEVLA
jgi:uncharacterized protein YqhQ